MVFQYPLYHRGAETLVGLKSIGAGRRIVNLDITRLLLSAVAIVGPFAVIVRFIYKRFRQSGSNEIEPFVRYATQGLKYYVGRYLRRHLAAELTLRQYARLQLRTTGRVMLVPATYPVQLDVDHVFVPLLLRDGGGDQVEHDNLLEQDGARILVLGEPGSGKSSLLKRLFWDACRRAATAPRQAKTLLLFELKSLARESGPITGEQLLAAVTRPLENAAVFRADGAQNHLSHGAGFLVLLDGLDEVPSESTQQALDAVLALSAHLAETAPRSTIILSNRTQHYLQLRQRGLDEAFQVFSIRSFTLGDIYRFLSNWPFVGDARAHVTRLFSRLTQLPSLAEMCTNPLALSMFVARDQQTGGADSPETRSRFYQAYVEELLANRRARREELPAGRQRLKQARQQLLGGICLGHLLDAAEPANSLPKARFSSAVADLQYGGGDAERVLPELSTDTGLFGVEREGETFRFMHLTLCEFLAATEIVERGEAGWVPLASLLTSGSPPHHEPAEWHGRLTEVISFACGLAPRSLRARILKGLDRTGNRRLLLRAGVEAQAYEDPVVIETLRSEREHIESQPAERWDVEWFSRLRGLILALRDAAAGRRQELASDPNTLPSATAVLMRLMTDYNAEDALLPALARQDADSAISIAERTGRATSLAAVAAAADDFAVLQGILARCDAGVDGWKTALLTRATLESGIASLLGATFVGSPTDVARGRRGWRACYLTAGSVYGDLLDELLPSMGRDVAPDRLLAGIAVIRPPRSRLAVNLRDTLPVPLWERLQGRELLQR